MKSSPLLIYNEIQLTINFLKMNRVRKPVVAGTFYAREPERLKDQLRDAFTGDFGPGEVPHPEGKLTKPVGIVVPHAGYLYSGQVAAHSFRFLGACGKPTTVIIMGTNHTGLGYRVSVATEGLWETPLGQVPINSDLAKFIAQKSDQIKESEEAFRREHSIEVQLPFLQFIYDRFEFVPLCLKDQSMEVSKALGDILAQIPKEENVAILASSDFTHYEPQEIAEKKDRRAIAEILELNIDGFYETIRTYSISICGYGSIAALMAAAKKLDLSEVSLLSYATSGEITGKKDQVVGYAGISFAS